LASLAVGIIGAGAGFLVGGPAGIKWGWAIGQTVGGMLFPPRLGQQGSGRLDDLKVSGSAYGTPIPIIYGQMRVPGIYTWSPDLVEVSSGGGKNAGKGKAPGGAKYTASFAVAFCEGEVQGVKRIWADDKLIYEDGELVEGFGEITIYLGDETQVADPLIEADKGVGNVSAHRGICYVVFEEMPLDKFGNRRPNLSAEIEGSELSYTSILQSSQETVVVKKADGSIWMGGGSGFGGASLSQVVASGQIGCAIKSSDPTALYIDDTGQLWGNGANNSSSLTGVSVFGNGDDTNSTTVGWVDEHEGSALPNLGIGIVGLCGADSHVHCIKSDGTLWFWGTGGSGIFPQYSYRGDGSTSASDVPVQVHAGNCLQVVVNTEGVAILLDDGTVECTGQGFSGWMGNGDVNNRVDWTVSDITGVVRISGGGGSTSAVLFAVKDDGTLWVCGDSSWNAHPGASDITAWVQVAIDAFIVDVRATKDTGVCALDNQGRVWAWGEGYEAGQGVTGTTERDPEIVISNVRAIGANHADLFVITDADDVYAWGKGTNNQRGDNSSTDLSTPTLMPWEATRQGETVQSVLEKISAKLGLDSSDYDFTACSGSTVTGYGLFQRDEARNLIDPLIRCHFVDVYEADGQIFGEIRGGAVTHTIPEDDMQAHESGTQMPPFCEHVRGNVKELPARIDLYFFSSARDYDQITQSATNTTYPQAFDSVSVNYPGTLSNTNARHIGEALLWEQLTQRDSYRIQLGSKYFGIIPSDRPEVPVVPGATETEMKVAKSDFSVFGLQKLELVKHDPHVYEQVAEGATIEPSTTTLYELQPTTFFGWAGNAINDEDALDGNFGVYLCASAPDGRWDGSHLWFEGYYQTGGDPYFTRRARAGLATTILAAPTVESTGVWDTVSTVTVDMMYGTLVSVARVDVLNGANRAYIGGVNDGEYIGFSTVTSLGNGVYQLSDLLRGQRGTDTNWGDHSVGDQFVILDDVSRVIPPTAGTTQRLGDDIEFKQAILIDDGSITINVDGAEITPYSAASVLVERDGSENITLTWLRRTRAGGELQDLVDVPLSEYDARWRVDWYDPTGATIERSSSVTAETATYSAANQTTDGYTPGDPVKFKIHQIGKWKITGGTGSFDRDGYSPLYEL
jgi:hypothetical protein